MTSQDKADHWRDLASDLGAEVPPEKGTEEEPKPTEAAGKPQASCPTPPEPEQAVAPPSDAKSTPLAPKPKSPPRRSTPGWATLAEQFGLSPSESSPKKMAEVVPPAPESASPVPSAPAEAAESIELPPARTQPRGEKSQGETLPSEEAVGDEVRGEAESSTPEMAERSPPRKRRKRHRRTRKSDLVITPDEAAEEEMEILTEPDAIDLFQEDRAEALAESEPAPEEPKAEEEKEATEGRSKRRRRRRPGRAKSVGEAETEQPGQRAGARPAEPESVDEDEESDGDEEESSAKESSPAHRGIPTWQDAVGVIISANIEARGKRPAGPPSRPRGGRGRGGREGSRKPN